MAAAVKYSRSFRTETEEGKIRDEASCVPHSCLRMTDEVDERLSADWTRRDPDDSGAEPTGKGLGRR